MSIETQHNFSEIFLQELAWLPDDDEIYEWKSIRDCLDNVETHTGETVGDFNVAATKIDTLLVDGFIEANAVIVAPSTEVRVTQAGIRLLDDLDASLLPKKSPPNLQTTIDSTDWTGLGKRISEEHRVVIREKATALLQAILQSDTDIQTRADAHKRVEAAITLLEAPNVPWREVVNLFNHPSVTAFLAAMNLLQLILGLAN